MELPERQHSSLMATLGFCFQSSPVLSPVLHCRPPLLTPPPLNLFSSTIYTLYLKNVLLFLQPLLLPPLLTELTSPFPRPLRDLKLLSFLLMYLEGGRFPFFHPRKKVVRGSPLRTELCPLHFERWLEYWLAEERVDATAKVTVLGVGGGVLNGERSCFQKKPPCLEKTGLSAAEALCLLLLSLLLPCLQLTCQFGNFLTHFVSTSPHQRAFLSFFFQPRRAKKK